MDNNYFYYNQRFSLYGIAILFLLIMKLSILNAQYTCPKPYNSQFEAHYTHSRYFYVAPGQPINVHVRVVANPCPCTYKGDTWSLGNYIYQYGSVNPAWPGGVLPNGMDCFNEFFSFNAPFNIDDYGNDSVDYNNLKAGLLFCQIVPYPEPD